MICECCDRRRPVTVCYDADDPDICILLCDDCRRSLSAEQVMAPS